MTPRCTKPSSATYLAACLHVVAPALMFNGAALAQTPTSSAAPQMNAIVYHNFGSPDVLRLERVDKPVPDDDQILVKVRAAAVNPLDWHFMEGTPYVVRPLSFGLRIPNTTRIGVDYAGTVEAVGKNVTQFKPGDEVFGGQMGSLAEYVCANETRPVVLKPANLTFEQAASIPIAGLTALQALRDSGQIKAGQRVLINGASGGVGTFAVQLAKWFGADVTGVCSTRNIELVLSLGADRVVDYTKDNFTKGEARYDIVIDNVANRSLLEFRRILKPKGKYVLVGGGGPNDGRWAGPLIRPLKALLLSKLVSQDMGMMLASMNKQDLTLLGTLIQDGTIRAVIDKQYRLSEAPEAMRYLEAGRARGKVIVTVGEQDAIPAVSSGSATNSQVPLKSNLIALTLIAIVVGVSIVPIVVALVLNRRFRRRNPGKKPFRWGYYFSVMSLLGGIGLGLMFQSGAGAVIICGGIYAVLAWFFAQRRRWAWVTLTLLSLNPVAWIINLVYLRKRWAEASLPALPVPQAR